MTSYREVLNNKEDIKKVVEILNNLKQKAEVIILPLKESQSKKIDETDSVFDKFQINMSKFKFDREEAHER